MSARYVVRKAEGIGGDPIPDDEPCFVVRGQDVLAPALLGEYILRYREVPGYDPEVEAELSLLLMELGRWQASHFSTVKTADK